MNGTQLYCVTNAHTGFGNLLLLLKFLSRASGGVSANVSSLNFMQLINQLAWNEPTKHLYVYICLQMCDIYGRNEI